MQKMLKRDNLETRGPIREHLQQFKHKQPKIISKFLQCTFLGSDNAKIKDDFFYGQVFIKRRFYYVYLLAQYLFN